VAARRRGRRSETNTHPSAALAALTAAALALPGLSPTVAHAADGDEVTFNLQHYQEGERDLNGQTYSDLNLKPLHADSLSVGVGGALAGRWTFGLSYAQDTWSGATPVASLPEAAILDQIASGASSPNEYFTDAKGHPVDVNWSTYDGTHVDYARDPRLVHVMGSASPETRQQATMKLGYAWDGAAVGLSGGVSVEPDYFSRFLTLDGHVDANRGLTTVNWSFSHTWSDVHASLEADTAADWGTYLNQIHDQNGARTLFGSRRDTGASLGATQIINKDALFSASLELTTSAGDLSNPYKDVIFAFDDPSQFVDSTGLHTVVLKGVLERRPEQRFQGDLYLRYVQYVAPLDASLHVDYRFFADDWGIRAHTFDAAWYQPLGGGWLASIGARYYTQSAADFYQPFFLFHEAFPILLPWNPELPRRIDFTKIPIANYSSDPRLSAFGVLSGRAAVSKQVREGLRLEVGGEYSQHAGSLRLGGRGAGAFADFGAYSLYASLTLDLQGSLAGDGAPSTVADLDRRLEAPAGVRFDRLLDRAGEIAVGYRFLDSLRGDGILNGSRRVGDDELTNLACGADPCQLAPERSADHASILELMYAPTGWLTLMVAPELIDRHLDVRPLNGGFFGPPFGGFPGLGGGVPNYRTSTGGLGDVGFYGLFRLFDQDSMRVQAGIGVIAPTGDPGVRISKSQDQVAYDLQLGGGVWALQPSLTWLGRSSRLTWGAQVSGVAGLEARNREGYAPGDKLDTSAWAGYDVLSWLTGTVRVAHSRQTRASGSYRDHSVPTIVDEKYVGDRLVPIYASTPTPHAITGPMDVTSNQGGDLWNLGLGIEGVVPSGPLAGQRLAVEWMQPLHDHVYGYQLKHTGTLSVSWRMGV
jgi:hypothetical protein